MRTLHQTLHLQRHRHTGKLLPHQHTSYRSLGVVLVVSGVFLTGLGAINHAAAETFGVSAVVAVPTPTDPPIITSPAAGTKLSGSSTLVIGSCPIATPQAVVSVNVDGAPAGTSTCDSNNDFSVPINVTSGNHSITASVLTVTDGQGRTSAPIEISTGNTIVSAQSISIIADQPFIYAADKTITWTGNIGTADQGTVYVHVDWGDNSQSSYKVIGGTQDFTHQYATVSSHNILLSTSNTSGAQTAEQFASAAFTAYTAPVVSSSMPTSPFITRTVIGLYGLYITTLAVTAIIWLEAKHARLHSQQQRFI